MSSRFTAHGSARACAAGARMVLGIAAACGAAHAIAQAHEVSRAGYTLRASAVSSTMVAPQTARRHGIERGPGHGVLNVTVSRNNAQGRRAVAADVHARIEDLAGTRRDVHMRQVRRGRYVSYTGNFDFAARAVLDFRVEARPRESDAPLVLTFRDRMPQQ